MIADLINGSFEILGGLFILNHCRVVLKDKRVAGVSVVSVAFFTAWGFWNLYYYPSLNQWWSFAGGCVVVAAKLCGSLCYFAIGGTHEPHRCGRPRHRLDSDLHRAAFLAA